MSWLGALARHVARTPLHPQWLLGRRRVPAGLTTATGRILDIGAADRWLSEHVVADTHYVALDLPATGATMYRSTPDVFADGAALPFANASLDGVACLEVLEHTPDPQAVLAEIHRVLKPRGTAWISMPFLYPVHDAPYDFQRYTEFGLRRRLGDAGFTVVSLERAPHSVKTAALLLALSIAGPLRDLRGPSLWLRLPFAIPMVVIVNVGALALAKVWPDWRAMGSGYEVRVEKA